MQDGYNDYDQHHDDDDTICYLLKNIKFKLNYMRIYWEKKRKLRVACVLIQKEKFARKTIYFWRKKNKRHLNVRQIISRGIQIEKKS